jgi:hypothetical protein
MVIVMPLKVPPCFVSQRSAYYILRPEALKGIKRWKIWVKGFQAL